MSRKLYRPLQARAPRGIVRSAALTLALLLCAGVPAAAQSGAGPSPVERAASLRDQGDLASAATLLREHLAAAPGDAGAARMLAQTLYWMGDVAGARTWYDAYLSRTPDDPHLRMDYGRMLMETGQADRARALLLPLRATPLAAEAEALLGTLAYWQGDLSAARRHLRAALRLDPRHAEALRQIDEIGALTAPWIAVGAYRRTDDQPVDQDAARVEVGLFPTPLHSIVLRAEPQRFTAESSGGIVQGEAAWRGFWPGLRLETELGAGAVGRGIESGTDWTARAAIGLRLPYGAVARARVERAPYHWTRSSLSSAVVTESATGLLAWNRGGWMGEAGYGVERYPDANRVRGGHGWLLVPVLRTAPLRLHVGYGFSARDAEETRYDAVSGRYAPYYTPDDQRIHEVLGSVAVAAGPALNLHASGAYGVAATERVPDRSGAPLTFARSYHPWSVRGTASLALSDALSLSLGGEHRRTAYYTLSQLSSGIVYHFRPRPSRVEAR